MGLTESPLRSKCGAHKENSGHVLRTCGALVTLRYHYLGSFSLDPEDVRNMALEWNWIFIKWQKSHDLDFSSKGHKVLVERPGRDSNDIISMGKNRISVTCSYKNRTAFLFPRTETKTWKSSELSVACEREWKAMRSLTPSLDCRRGFINRDLPPRAIGRQNYTSYSGSAWERPTRCTLFLIIYFT